MSWNAVFFREIVWKETFETKYGEDNPVKMLMPYLKYLLTYSTVVPYEFMVLNGGADKAVQNEKKWFLL